MSDAVSTTQVQAAAGGGTGGTLPNFNVRPDRVGRWLTFLCGGALAFNLLLVLALIALLAWEGLGYFWPKPLELFTLADGRRVLAEVRERAPVAEGAPGASEGAHRIKIKAANRDLGAREFEWIDERDIRSRELPAEAALLERMEWGNLHGFVREVRRGDEVLASGAADAWALLRAELPRKRAHRKRIERLVDGELSDVNDDIRALDWKRNKVALADSTPEEKSEAVAEIERESQRLHFRSHELAENVRAEQAALARETVLVEDAAGAAKSVPISNIVRAVQPNALGFWAKVGLYLSRAWEFVSDEPRESNTEGGIFPAIFGTVLMVLLMSIVVMPMGVLAALYLREYAKQGAVVRLVRIAVNNLAGTPSIVFGIFGLGFFVYFIGGGIDALFYPERLPTPTYGTGCVLWASLTLALLTVPVVIVATEEGLAAVPRIVREGSLALGATKWETMRKVVIPASMPAILTGLILAMGRAAGEVAPLMIVGMVKVADVPTAPNDKFMHLGYHIKDVGFQSPNVEATKGLVAATALLLIAIVTIMNLAAIRVRNHLRRKYAHSGV